MGAGSQQEEEAVSSGDNYRQNLSIAALKSETIVECGIGEKSDISLANIKCKPITATDDTHIKPSLKRFVILTLFCLNSANKSYQWLQVPSSTTKATILYDTDNYMINFTSILFMLAFVLLSWPACYIIEHLGTRKVVLLASLGTSIGATIKCFSCHGEGIWLLIIGQTFVSVSEQLIFSLPSRLASVWFPDHQVSLCVALCVVGGQLGLAMGFIVPQLFLEGAETRDEIAQGFKHMFLATAIVSIAILIVCILLFDNEPAYVPGAARAKQLVLERERRLELEQSQAGGQLMLLATSYGIIVGLGYTIQTLLDQLLKPVWPNDDLVVGNTGFLIIVSGILATPIWGRALDSWHAFKSINVIIAVGALGSLVLVGFVLVVERSQLGMYLAAVLFGLFSTGFIVSGLEYAVELTYPAPELLTSSMLNLMPQIHSTVFILVGSYIVDTYGPLATSLFFVGLLMLALVFLLATRETLKRQAAVAQMAGKPAPRTALVHA